MPDETAVNTATQLVNNVGFPVAMCILLLGIIVYLIKSHKEENEKTNAAISKITEAVNANTQVMTVLKEKIANG